MKRFAVLLSAALLAAACAGASPAAPEPSVEAVDCPAFSIKIVPDSLEWPVGGQFKGQIDIVAGVVEGKPRYEVVRLKGEFVPQFDDWGNIWGDIPSDLDTDALIKATVTARCDAVATDTLSFGWR